MTREELVDILEHYVPLSASLLARRKILKAQIEEIWEVCYIKGVSYDKSKVMATKTDYTEGMSSCSDATKEFDEELAQIEEQISIINNIRKKIYEMPCIYQTILTQIFLNEQTITSVAIDLHMTRNTIAKHKELAIDMLYEMM